ncbi:Uncharacterized protein HZ326_10453 [Fusarium oxysporum f. sp. albedinis]|nr:Uncharacterized protein HZ326_10453 [Fusarium oxysporum f. sp. albedinis]
MVAICRDRHQWFFEFPLDHQLVQELAIQAIVGSSCNVSRRDPPLFYLSNLRDDLNGRLAASRSGFASSSFIDVQYHAVTKI